MKNWKQENIGLQSTSNDGQLIDSDLKMTLSIDSSDNQLKKLSDKVNALDDITLDKESDVEEAKEFYDNMSNALQNQVSDELQKKLRQPVLIIRSQE